MSNIDWLDGDRAFIVESDHNGELPKSGIVRIRVDEYGYPYFPIGGYHISINSNGAEALRMQRPHENLIPGSVFRQVRADGSLGREVVCKGVIPYSENTHIVIVSRGTFQHEASPPEECLDDEAVVDDAYINRRINDALTSVAKGIDRSARIGDSGDAWRAKQDIAAAIFQAANQNNEGEP